MFFKIGVLRFTIFTGKHLCWGLFLINLQALRPTNLFKRDFLTGASREYRKIFTNMNTFLENAPAAAFVSMIK